MKKKRIAKNIAYWSGVVILGLVIGFSIQFVTAWTEPSANPPGGNLGAPINTSEIQQTKLGNFIAQNLGAFNLTLIQKGYSASTTANDPGNTLVTKDYVDAQSSSGKWFFLNDSCQKTIFSNYVSCTAKVKCPPGTKIVAFKGGIGGNGCELGNNGDYSGKIYKIGDLDNRSLIEETGNLYLTASYINNSAINSCTSITIPTDATEYSCTVEGMCKKWGNSYFSGKIGAGVAVICN